MYSYAIDYNKIYVSRVIRKRFRIFPDQESARTFRNGDTVSEWRVAHIL